ncbi:uncharacterized protein LOC130749646 [Lotus japonicus]|uniref:uncharacterized protein LOC130749646 n=1 Tax=Lotus japonicus TaxID=34305 RepID=UPI0025827C92|nr:uncharacterized protein LOC130749646 [Lotus japonicus]
MPGASVSSPSASLIPDHDSKDFAPPVKKLKVEEDNTDSAIDLTPREAFEIWCDIYGKKYPNKDEKDRRFESFQQSLDRTIPSTSSHAINFPLLADRTADEFDAFRTKFPKDCYSSVSRKQLKAPIPIPEDSDPELVAAAAMDITPEEAFKSWREVWEKEYANEKEVEDRFNVLKQNLVLTLPPKGVSYPGFADITEEEFKTLVDRPGYYNRITLLDVKLGVVLLSKWRC